MEIIVPQRTIVASRRNGARSRLANKQLLGTGS
jgi:hypothetical protein